MSLEIDRQISEAVEDSFLRTRGPKMTRLTLALLTSAEAPSERGILKLFDFAAHEQNTPGSTTGRTALHMILQRKDVHSPGVLEGLTTTATLDYEEKPVVHKFVDRLQLIADLAQDRQMLGAEPCECVPQLCVAFETLAGQNADHDELGRLGTALAPLAAGVPNRLSLCLIGRLNGDLTNHMKMFIPDVLRQIWRAAPERSIDPALASALLASRAAQGDTLLGRKISNLVNLALENHRLAAPNP